MADNKGFYYTRVQPKFDLIGAWIRDGYTLEEIAIELGIHVSTLRTYLNKHEEFRQLFDENRKRIDLVHVANAYFKCCIGYTVVEETRQYVYKDGERVLVAVKEKERHIPPNPMACERWISSRFKEYKGWEDFGKRDVSYDVEEAQGGVIVLPERVKASDNYLIEFESKERTEKGLENIPSPMPDAESV